MTDSLYLGRAFHVAFSAAEDLLTAYWSDYIPDEVLQLHFGDLLTAASTHGKCRFWLLDLRGCQWFSTQLGTWVSTSFATQAFATLGNPVFLACIFDPNHRVAASSFDVSANLRAGSAQRFYPYFFDNEVDARAWLHDQQRLDPQPSSGPARIW